MTKIKTKTIVFAFATALLIAGSASAQSISIVSGNGQLICTICASTAVSLSPAVVQVKSATGAPLPGATISWVFNNPINGFGTVGAATTVTDANGQSSNPLTFTPSVGSLLNTPYVQGTVTATLTALPSGTTGSTNQSVVFTETVALSDLQTNPGGTGTGILQVAATLVAPAPGTTLTGPAGSTSSTPIQVRVTGVNSAVPVPGVAVIVLPPTDTTQPTISCAPVPGGQPNTAITDGSGIATCNVVFGPRLGSGNASIAVGQTSSPFASLNGVVNFTVTQGNPGAIQISSGNNQSGNAGGVLPSPLVAIVTDQAGNPLSGANVQWAVTQGSATLTNQRTVSDANGRVSANLTLGSSPGNITVAVTVPGFPQVPAGNFTATVNLAISQLQKLAGDNQSTPVNTAFPNTLVVQVNNNGAPVQGVTVNFTVTSGSVTIPTPNPTTNAQGQAQATVQAGPNAGNAVVTATVGTFSATFNLTVSPPGPALTSSSFRNAASGQVGAISPCSLATIVAQGLAPGLQGVIAPPIVGVLPQQVNNTTVAFLNPQNNTNIFAPIYNVANVNGAESMTIEIPCELSPGTVNVTVNVASGSKSVTVNLLPAAPGIFETAGTDRRMRGVLIRPDGTFVTRENPARKGETVHMLATGLGPVVPQIGTNQVGVPGTDSNVSDALIVGVNNAGVQVTGATYARDLIGVYDISFVIPADSPTGDINLALAVNLGGTLTFGNGSIVPIQ